VVPVVSRCRGVPAASGTRTTSSGSQDREKAYFARVWNEDVNLYRSVRAVAGASGDGPLDWGAVTEAAKAATDKGSLDLAAGEREGYATDVAAARDRVGEVAGVDFDLPDTVEIQHRHHWIDANVATFERVFEPLEDATGTGLVPGVARVANTGSMSVALAFFARNVLGQYDPLLLADVDPEDHGLYFVRPNILAAAEELDTDYDRFRRWIAFHEVTHAAEFAAAPWLGDHMERSMRESLEEVTEQVAEGNALSTPSMELDTVMTTMTAVEGYAELLMDRAFDEEYDDLRAKLDARRGGGGPVTRLLRRALGIDMKREQYERGREFFESVVDARSMTAASAVWDRPENIPTDAEYENPRTWLDRVHS